MIGLSSTATGTGEGANRDFFDLQDIERSQNERFLEGEEGDSENTFDPGFFENDKLTDGKTCLRDCIAQGKFSCRRFDAYDEGVCCLNDDFACLNGNYDLCSNQFQGIGREIFSCPFETLRCGT